MLMVERVSSDIYLLIRCLFIFLVLIKMLIFVIFVLNLFNRLIILLIVLFVFIKLLIMSMFEFVFMFFFVSDIVWMWFEEFEM